MTILVSVAKRVKNSQHTFILGEIGELILGLEIVSEHMESVSLEEVMSLSITHRSSRRASKSTSPLPVGIEIFVSVF